MRLRWIAVGAVVGSVAGQACSSSSPSRSSGGGDDGGGGSSSGSASSSGSTSGGGSDGGGLATPTVLADNQNNILACAVDSTSVYWINGGDSQTSTYNGSVAEVAVGGGTVTTLVPSIAPLAMALGSGRVYYTAFGANATMSYVPVGGGAATAILTSTTSSNEYDVFTVTSTGAYFLDAQKVESVSLTGGTPKALYTAGTAFSNYGIAADGTSVYWSYRKGASSATAGGVQKIPLAGATTPTPVATGLNTPTILVIDATNAYWYDDGSANISKAPLAGGTPVVLASHDPNALNPVVVGPSGLAVDGTNVYWSNGGGNGIYAVPIAGGTPTLIADPLDPTCVAVDATSVYWGTGGNSGTIAKVAK